jgi:hypothetical protein
MTPHTLTIKHHMTEDEQNTLENAMLLHAQESRESVRGFGLLMLMILSVTALGFVGAVAQGLITL